MKKIEGKVLHRSIKNNGVEIEGSGWINMERGLPEEDKKKIKKSIEELKNGDIISITMGKKGYIGIEKRQKQTEFKQANNVRENTDSIMLQTLKRMNSIYESDELTAKFKENLDWTKISISLFISKIRGEKYEKNNMP